MCENCAIVFSGLLQGLAILVAAYVAAQAALFQLERQFKIRQHQAEQANLERTADTLIALLVDVDGAIDGWTSQFGPQRVDAVKGRIIARKYRFYSPESKMIFSNENLRESFDSIPASCIRAVVDFYKQDGETVDKMRFFRTEAFTQLDPDLKMAAVDILVLEGVQCVEKALKARKAVATALYETISRLSTLIVNAPAGSFRLDGHKTLVATKQGKPEHDDLLIWAEAKIAELKPQEEAALKLRMPADTQAASEQDDGGSGPHRDNLQEPPTDARTEDSDKALEIQ